MYFYTIKILFVEDEKGLLNEIRSFLEKEDHICEQAESYAEAEEKVMLYLYDIALIDITLPGGSGLDVIRRLRSKLMTALSAIVALLPLGFALGTGAKMHQSLAIAVIGGLIIALPVLLLILPSFINLIEK